MKRAPRRLYACVLPVFLALAQSSSALVLIGSGAAHEASLTKEVGFDLVLHHHEVPRSAHHHDHAHGHADGPVDTSHHADETAPGPDHVVRDSTDPGLVRHGASAGVHAPVWIIADGYPAAGCVISRTLQAPRGTTSGPAPPLFALATIILRI